MTDQTPPRIVPSFGQRVIGAAKSAYSGLKDSIAPTPPPVPPEEIKPNGQGIGQIPQNLTDAFSTPFGPGLPPQVSQLDDQIRLNGNYNSWNAVTIPRAELPATMSFQAMRNLLNNYHWSAITVKRLMDALAAVKYDVVAVDQNDNEKYKAEIEDMTARLVKPDGKTEFGTWYLKYMRAVIETDSGVLNKTVTRGGELIGLEPINGETIKVFVGKRGELVGYGQVISGQVRSTYKNDDPSSIYNEIWGANELFYKVRWPNVATHYGNPPIETVAKAIVSAINEETLRSNFFSDGTLPPGFLALPPNISTKEVAQLQRSFDNMMRGNSKLRVALQFLPGGRDVQYIPMKPADWQITTVADYYRRICLAAFGVNDAFLGITNTIHKSSSQQQSEVMDDQTIKPHVDFFAEAITSLIQAPQPHGFGHPYLELQPRRASDKKTAEKVSELAVAIEHDMITPEQAAQVVYPEIEKEEEEDGRPLPPDSYWPQAPLKSGQAPPKGGA